MRRVGVYGNRRIVDAGGLMSYGVDHIDLWRLAANYVDHILRDANPADLPVQAPMKYDTVVNLKVATARGLDVPSSLLARADEGDRRNSIAPGPHFAAVYEPVECHLG